MSGQTFDNLGNDQSGQAIDDYLSHVASLPFTQSYIRQSLAALELSPGDVMIDLGCGVAHDAAQVCSNVAPGGKVIFIDHDVDLLERARNQNLPDTTSYEFNEGDVHQLQVPEKCADGVRIVRTLQHVANPKKALGEMLRILKNGKHLVSVEPDWSTFSVSPGERISKILRDQISSGIRNPVIGSQVEAYLQELGAHDIRVEKLTISFNALADAEKFFLLNHKLSEAMAQGVLDSGSISEWTKQAEQATATGDFESKLDFTFVRAMK